VALTFRPVPDWTSSENQGGNLAVADLDEDGLPELIILRVDHPIPDGFALAGASTRKEGWGAI
jgi:hypothetical protein